MLFGEIITYIYCAHTRENYKMLLMTKDNYKLTHAREKNIPKTDYRFSV